MRTVGDDLAPQHRRFPKSESHEAGAPPGMQSRAYAGDPCGVEPPKFSVHPFHLAWLQQAPKWPLVSFPRIGTLTRHPLSLNAARLAAFRGFSAIFHKVAIAAIGHMPGGDR